MNRVAILVALAAMLGHGAAQAQDGPGDPARGLVFAKQACAECHGVEANSSRSPNSAAPTFKTIANLPGMTGTALTVWMQSPHPSMPMLMVPTEDRQNVISYILTLKEKRASAR